MWPESQHLICVWVTPLCDAVHQILYGYRLSSVTACDWVTQCISMDTIQFCLSLTYTEFSRLIQRSVLRYWKMRWIRCKHYDIPSYYGANDSNVTHVNAFYIHGSVYRNPILIRSNKMQQYAGIYLLQNRSLHVSGVHRTHHQENIKL